MIDENLSDSELISRYLTGEVAIITILVKRWHQTFFVKSNWILKDKSLTKDVMQDCWVHIIEKLGQLQDHSKFKSWALRIVYHRSIDASKRRRVERQRKVSTTARTISGDHEKEVYNERKRALRSVINSLSSDKQDIIRLFYTEEYRIKEIADFLDLPLGTVKSRLFNAREEIKRKMKTYNYEK